MMFSLFLLAMWFPQAQHGGLNNATKKFIPDKYSFRLLRIYMWSVCGLLHSHRGDVQEFPVFLTLSLYPAQLRGDSFDTPTYHLSYCGKGWIFHFIHVFIRSPCFFDFSIVVFTLRIRCCAVIREVLTFCLGVSKRSRYTFESLMRPKFPMTSFPSTKKGAVFIGDESPFVHPLSERVHVACSLPFGKQDHNIIQVMLFQAFFPRDVPSHITISVCRMVSSRFFIYQQ